MNNFHDLFDDDKHNYRPEQRRTVRNGLWQTLGTFKFVGQIVDVYLPAMMNILVAVVGGEANGQEPNARRSARGQSLTPPPGINKEIPPQKGPEGDDLIR
jgi:hypothetical protein